eukprot:11874876-Prorocentrum_lima.AAC.1
MDPNLGTILSRQGLGMVNHVRRDRRAPCGSPPRFLHACNVHVRSSEGTSKQIDTSAQTGEGAAQGVS